MTINHIQSHFTVQRLERAQAQLNSAVADAAAQGTLDEANAGRITNLVSEVPDDQLHREVVTEQAERLANEMSYLNRLHASGQVETEWARMVFAANDPKLICCLIEASRRDFSLIEQRLDEGVKASVIDVDRKAAILANPYLNLQAADALEVISKVGR
jgi:hypothetical protein